MKPGFKTYILILLMCLPQVGNRVFGQATNSNTNNSYNEEDLRNRASKTEINLSPQENQVPNPSMNLSSATGLSKQSASWKEVVALNPKLANAWMNYYESTRYSYYSSTSKELSSAEEEELNEIVADMEKNVPGTFEYHYVKYINGNHDVSLFPHLQKAYELNSSCKEMYDEFVAYYEITGDAAKKREFCRKMDASNDWPANIKNFAQNLLRSVEKNAILITHGEMDTYPVYTAQELLNERKDVKVVSYELLHSAEYRKKIEKDFGIKINWRDNAKAEVMAKLVADLAGKHTVYVASTFSPELLTKIKDKLYITGLAMRYSETEFDNKSELKNNWEKNLRMDYLNKNIADSYTKKINANYLPCLILLKQIYVDDGKTEQAKKVQNLALKLARESGKEQQVKSAMGL